MLRITGIRQNSEVFGIVEIHLELDPCEGIVNDWRLEIDGAENPGYMGCNAIDFIESKFTNKNHDCSGCPCEIPSCPGPNKCSAIFLWNTSSFCDGTCSITGHAKKQTSESLQITVNNIQSSYRVLNKQLLSSDITKLNPGNVELIVSTEILRFIETLPKKTGYIDLEINSNELFTAPYNGQNAILGNLLIERILDLRDAPVRNIGDAIQIDLPENCATYFMDEFATIHPKIEVGVLESSQTLNKEIVILDSKEFPVTNACSVEEQ